MPESKKYQFDGTEIELLRDAMADLKHHLTPPPNASERRQHLHRVATALFEQFRDDLRSGQVR